MIRIDEIYNHTFWPWIDKNKPDTRMFFCDPPGRTDPDALFNLGRDDIIETDYVFFHDQEPIWMDLHQPLFDDVLRRNTDVWWNRYSQKKPNPFGHVVVSERGEYVDQLCKQYEWQSHYYFYHGWACQDWFRGYDKTFLIPRARDRAPTQTFISPNRIVAGKRDHRVLFLYNIFKHQLEHNHISAPRMCSYENVDISTIATKYYNIYPDIKQVFDQAPLPKLFSGEDTQHMTSCWLTNFNEVADSLLYVPTETVYFGRRQHITEKTFEPLIKGHIILPFSNPGTISRLVEMGFQMPNCVDYSFDSVEDPAQRFDMIVAEFKTLMMQNLPRLYKQNQSVFEHNQRAVEHIPYDTRILELYNV
jgi:hypothetical protein